MNKLTLSVLFFIAFAGYSQKITFNLHSPDLSDTTSVYIVGSHMALGMWNPGAVLMEYKGDQIWTKTITVEQGFPGIEYKYTLGSWDNEGASANGRPLSNFHFKIKNDTSVTNMVNFWTNGPTRINHGQITGTVKYHKNLEGEGVLPRDIIVWLPPSYNENMNKRYPVLYMHDGQNIIDPATSSFGYDWRVDEIADSLIAKNEIPEIIIVGMNNTVHRAQEYGPGPKGADYMKFVVNEVKPLIDNNYRTKTGSEHTYVGGSSMGGIISFRMVWEYPEIFSKAICMSPAFKIRQYDYLSHVEKSDPPKNVFFYIDNGGIGLELELQSGIDDMMEALENKGLREDYEYVWFLDQNAQHNEQAWSKRMPEALKILLKDDFK